MLSFLSRAWRTFSLAMTLLAIYLLPYELQNLEQATEPWAAVLSLLSKERALWVVSGVMLVWIAWIDARPYVLERMRPKFPPAHAAICRRLAENLASLKASAMSYQVRNYREKIDIERNLNDYFEVKKSSLEMAEEISYDKDTSQSVRDFIHLCDILIGDQFSFEDDRDIRSKINNISKILFEQLHSGRSIKRSLLPLPDWM